MEFKAYKYKYYLNVQRSFDYNKENAHNNTFALTLFIEVMRKDCFNMFMFVDDVMKVFLNEYKGQYLNGISPFDQLNPTIENIGDTFFDKLKILFLEIQHNIVRLEISETPLRVYAISDKLFLRAKYFD